MELHDLFYRWMDEYASVLSHVNDNNDLKNPFRNIITKDIRQLLEKQVPDRSHYKVKGSCGNGRWASVPWVSIFDLRITKSAQEGVYIVYLLNKDTKTLYLTLNQGVTAVATNTSPENKNKNKKSILQETAEDIRTKIGDATQSYDGIDSGSPDYDAGCIYYKKYELNSLPDDDQLISDLQEYLALYADYYNKIYAANTIAAGVHAPNNPTVSSGEVKDIIANIKKYIAAQGFTYEDGFIENFYLSLKSKPFVILAGTSGTGKTRLVRLFAQAVGATSENGRYKMVSVRPDWSDSSDLFGHVDLNGKFIPGAIIKFIKDAEEDIGHPYFLCLDEMNLARVEYYLSDILSVMETRDFEGGTIQSDPLLLPDYYGADQSAVDDYGEVRIPENLYIVGTVNMDETTFPFSRKVLDRANTIEFSYVDLMPNFEAAPATLPQAQVLDNAFLKTEYLHLAQCAEESDAISEYCLKLKQINQILLAANAHIGYRVRDEIVFYLLNNKKYHLLSEEAAMDYELLQKILPRIQGSSAAVKSMLCELFKFCAGDYDGYQVPSDAISDKMKKVLTASDRTIKYRRSAEKLELMTRRFEEDGFTSYWL